MRRAVTAPQSRIYTPVSKVSASEAGGSQRKIASFPHAREVTCLLRILPSRPSNLLRAPPRLQPSHALRRTGTRSRLANATARGYATPQRPREHQFRSPGHHPRRPDGRHVINTATDTKLTQRVD